MWESGNVIKNEQTETSLVGQWLRLCSPNAGGWTWFPGSYTQQLRCNTAK